MDEVQKEKTMRYLAQMENEKYLQKMKIAEQRCLEAEKELQTCRKRLEGRELEIQDLKVTA